MKKLLHIGVLALALAAPLAHAQSEPSMSDIYAAAQAGQMDKAHAMVQQVLVTHPNSAKAHYVQAELYAKEGRLALARENLAQAERIAPGLPFAKPQAVSALKAELAASPVHGAAAGGTVAVAPAQQDNSHWVWLVVLAGGVMVLGYFIFRDRRPAQTTVVYPDAGAGAAIGGAPYGGAPYGGAPYGATPYGYGNAQPGLGSRIAGGVATGLAVGAGVVAAEAIGERLFGHEDRHAGNAGGYNDGGNYVPMDRGDMNADMGGNNFGVSDTSWDDGGGSSGSDWDN